MQKRSLWQRAVSLAAAALFAAGAALPALAADVQALPAEQAEATNETAQNQNNIILNAAAENEEIAAYDLDDETMQTAGLQNGSFEDVDWTVSPYWPNNWQAGENNTAGAVFAAWKNDGVAKDGNYVVSAWAASAYTAEIYQTVTGLEPGKYQLTVWAQNSGGQNTCQLYGYGSGQTRRTESIAKSDAWKENTLHGIEVGEDGTATVGISIDANANNWVNLDLVTLTPDTETSDTAVQNASFENGEWVQGNQYTTPGWTLSTDITGSVTAKWNDSARDGKYTLSFWAESAYTAEVSQTVTGLEPGYYYLSAYTQKGNGGADDQPVCYLYGSGSGQSRSMTMIPRRGVESKANDWTLVTVRGIYVGEDGTASIGIYTQANGNNWLNVDCVALTRESDQTRQYQLLKGGDVSMMTQLEDNGAKFYDESGTEGDVLQIVGDAGWNITRIRLYTNPGKGRGDGTYYCPEGYLDLDDALEQARRTKEKGMQIELSLHYSDYWTNAATQLIPSDWMAQIEGKTTEEAVAILEDLMYTYTKEVMQAMKEQGTEPEYVSIGNEMQSGILYPLGKAADDRWPYLARFLNAAAKAVREVSPNCRIILHSDEAGNTWRYDNFFGKCETYGVDYDIIGCSYYPFWVDLEVSDIVDFCNTLVDTYGKDIILMETGFNFSDYTVNGDVGQLNHNGPYPWGDGASSPANQREFMAELFNGIKSVKDGRCIGDLYWDSLMVEQEGVGWALIEATDTADKNYISNSALFDFDHKLLPAADAYRYNQEGTATGALSGRLQNAAGAAIANVSGTVQMGEAGYPFTTDAYGAFRLTGLPAGTYDPTAAVTGLTAGTVTPASLTLTAGHTAQLTFTMSGANLSGTARDANGNALTGVTVTLQNDTGIHTTVTEANGGYCFADLPTGSYTLSALLTGYQAESARNVTLQNGENAAQDLTLALVSGTASGNVTDTDGTALAGVEVSCGSAHTETNGNGAYAMAGLTGGENTLTFYKDGYVITTKACTVQVGSTATVDAELLKNVGSITGVVLDADGSAIAGATVTLDSSHSATTDENGRYRFDDVAAGKATLEVTMEGKTPRTVTTAVQAGQISDAGSVILPTPVTLQNPSFETTDGWVFENDSSGGALYQQRSSDSQYDGTYALAFWAAQPFESDVYQTVSNLKAGQYVFRIHGYTGMTHTEWMDGTFYMYAKDAEGNLLAKADIPNTGAYLPCELIFTLPADGNCTIGFYADTISEDWSVLDLAQLGYMGVKPEPTAAPTATPEPTAAPTMMPESTTAPTAVPEPTAAGETKTTAADQNATSSKINRGNPTATPSPTGTPPTVPQTGDTLPLNALLVISVISFGALLGLALLRRRQ